MIQKDKVRDAVEYFKPGSMHKIKDLKEILEILQRVIVLRDIAEKVLAVKMPEFIPSCGHANKHMPTEEQIEMCNKNFIEYRKVVDFYFPEKSNLDEYDFNRGWEFGFGEAIKQCTLAITGALLSVEEITDIICKVSTNGNCLLPDLTQEAQESVIRQAEAIHKAQMERMGE